VRPPVRIVALGNLPPPPPYTSASPFLSEGGGHRATSASELASVLEIGSVTGPAVVLATGSEIGLATGLAMVLDMGLAMETGLVAGSEIRPVMAWVSGSAMVSEMLLATALATMLAAALAPVLAMVSETWWRRGRRPC